MSNLRKRLAANVRHYRNKQGLTQWKLDKVSNAGNGTTPKIEVESVAVNIDTIEKIAKGLGLDPVVLFLENDIDTSEVIKPVKKQVRDLEKDYAVYKGEDLLIVGTGWECLDYLEVSRNTFLFYLSDSYRKRAESRKGNKGGSIRVIELDDEEENN